jgi:hypothetical protein
VTLNNLAELNEMYRSVFGSERGQIVLLDILTDCQFFSLADISSSEDLARLNVARRILGKCGIWETVHAEEITEALVQERRPKEFLRRLFRLPIVQKKEFDND